MNFSLTEEQEFLQEAARNALGRVKTVEAARDALEGSELPDLWPAATEAGWPGLPILLVSGYAEIPEGAAVGVPRLAKPFRPHQLTAAILDLMRDSGPSKVLNFPGRA